MFYLIATKTITMNNINEIQQEEPWVQNLMRSYHTNDPNEARHRQKQHLERETRTQKWLGRQEEHASLRATQNFSHVFQDKFTGELKEYLIQQEALLMEKEQEKLRIQRHMQEEIDEAVIRTRLLMEQQMMRTPVNRDWEAENEELLTKMMELPVLRETEVNETNCPICFDELGETGKTVLKCGHPVCVSCFMQQILRATALKKLDKCECAICKVNFIK